MKKILEKDIQLAICDYLALKGYKLFWRQNTTPVFEQKSGFYRPMPKYSMKGVADIIIIKDGKAIFIEVKRKGNKLSEAQEEFKAKCEMVGARYITAYSLDDIIAEGL